MNLIGLGVHQHCRAIPATIIDGVSAGDYDRRRYHDSSELGGINQLEGDALVKRLLIFAHVSFRYRRERYRALSHRRLGLGPLSVITLIWVLFVRNPVSKVVHPNEQSSSP